MTYIKFYISHVRFPVSKLYVYLYICKRIMRKKIIHSITYLSEYLTAMCDFRTNGVSGTILTNNHARNCALFNKLSSYIMQEDLLRPNLTVFESMLIASRLKVGEEINEEDKVQSVGRLVFDLPRNIASFHPCFCSSQNPKIHFIAAHFQNYPLLIHIYD